MPFPDEAKDSLISSRRAAEESGSRPSGAYDGERKALTAAARMTYVLKMTGAIWLGLGAWGTGVLIWPIHGIWTESAAMSTAVTLTSNFIVFVVPGLTLFGVATLQRRTRPTPSAQAADSPPKPMPAGERLKRLRELKARGLMTEREYATRHAEIIGRV